CRGSGAEVGYGYVLGLVGAQDIAVLRATRRRWGRIVVCVGDGVMAVFSTPAPALRAALEMQGAARRVSLRIGIHDGAARSRDGDLIAHDVNVAARIAGRALGGEFLVGGAVRGGAGDLPVGFRAAAPLVLPGRAPERLFRVHAIGSRAGGSNDDTSRLDRHWRKNDARAGGVSVSHRQDHADHA